MSLPLAFYYVSLLGNDVGYTSKEATQGSHCEPEQSGDVPPVDDGKCGPIEKARKREGVKPPLHCSCATANQDQESA